MFIGHECICSAKIHPVDRWHRRQFAHKFFIFPIFLLSCVGRIIKISAILVPALRAALHCDRLQGCGINFFFGEGDASCPGIIPASQVGGGGDDDDDDDDGGHHGGHTGNGQPRKLI